MFILQGNGDGIRFKSSYQASNEEKARDIVAIYLPVIRNTYFLADFSNNGNSVTLDTPSEEATTRMTEQLNKRIFGK